MDPFRAISGRRKQWKIEEFFSTATPHMDQLFSAMSELRLPKAFDSALEFGCGAGRFLRHFEKRFAKVWGIDVSQEMLELAKRYNPRCNFHLNQSADLEFFSSGSFDLVYSFLVLQHLPDQVMIANYIKEFMRILKPGGLAVFQLPERLSLRWRIQPRRRIYHLLHVLGLPARRLQSWNLLPMRLISMPRSQVREIISTVKGKICREQLLDGNSGIMYYCTK